jgi:hypothetical protein
LILLANPENNRLPRFLCRAFFIKTKGDIVAKKQHNADGILDPGSTISGADVAEKPVFEEAPVAEMQTIESEAVQGEAIDVPKEEGIEAAQEVAEAEASLSETKPESVEKPAADRVRKPKMPAVPARRITGNDLVRFKIDHGLTDIELCRLFQVGPRIMSGEIARGNKGVKSRSICYLYRLFQKHPDELLPRPALSISDFYREIGGEAAIQGTEFSLYIGLELSAYFRFFTVGQSPGKGVLKVLDCAMKLNKHDPKKAFEMIKTLALEEGSSRGFNPIERRRWAEDDDDDES